MAEKISTIIISVDLDCRLCDKKIRKTLRKFPEIQKQTFDTKQNTVTVSGLFDPEKLSKCIRCRGGKSIKDIHIVKDPPPKPKADPPKPNPDPPKPAPPKPDPPKPDPPKPDPPKPAPPKPDPPKPDPPKPAPPKPDPPKPDPPKPDPPKPDPPKAAPPKPDPPKPDPPKADPPKPAPPLAYPPPYFCFPWYEGYEAGPCSSGWPYYPVQPGPPRVCCRHCYEGHYGGPCTSGLNRPSSCGFFSEEDQSCTMM